MKICIVCFYLLRSLIGLSQLTEYSDQTNIHAVVIGVSEYKNIRSLNFAHRDAITFADFVKNNPYWNNHKEVSLLLNEKATAGNIVAAMHQKVERIDSSDLFIFFFAGHGDVEAKTDGEYSYLLAYDSPLNVYDLGGVLSSKELEKLLLQVADKGANSLVIIDACRAGSFDLAGSAVGIDQTHLAFIKKGRSEIRVLSSQHSQKSIEKGDLGGGRGVFSYYLINGLNGEADFGRDSIINLNELNFYVTDKVNQETQGRQVPKFQSDNPMYILSFPVKNEDAVVSNEIDALIQSSRLTRESNIKDSACASYANMFYRTINLKGSSLESVFLSYYELANCRPSELKYLKGDLISYLIDTVHAISINSVTGQKLVDHSDLVFTSSIIDSIYKFSGDDNLFYSESLHRLKLYLNTMDFVYFTSNLPLSQRDSVLTDYKQRLIAEHELNSDFAHITFALSAVFSKLGLTDSSIYFLNQTIEKSPTWLYPRYLLIKKYRETAQNEKAFEALNSLLDMDSLYKNYDCLSCFFEEAHLLIENNRDPNKIDRLYSELLNRDLLSKEKSQILFYKYLNAKTFLSTFKRLLNYRQLKKNIRNSFSDRMILLTADVEDEKMFVPDKKILKLLGLMDSLAASNYLEQYFLNPGNLPDLLKKSENKLFFKYFPQGMRITDYSLEEYLVFKSYILFKLQNF